MGPWMSLLPLGGRLGSIYGTFRPRIAGPRPQRGQQQRNGSLICAAEALTNKGRFCLKYIGACQWGKLKV